MARIFITGAAGFVGQHLIRHLRHESSNDALHGTTLDPITDKPDAVHFHTVDLRDADAVREVIERVQPDQVYHLAAFAAVGASFESPWETLENNIRVQVNVLEAARRLRQPPRMVLVSSGEIYDFNGASAAPLDELAPFKPTSPYGVSKVTQDMLGLQYAITYRLPIIRARPFNHSGPGQRGGFVIPDFALQIANIEAGRQTASMNVGDMTVERDFTDVRDVVRAYHLLMQNGIPGEAYNVASGETVTIRWILETLLRCASCAVELRQDPALIRPTTIRKSWGDASKLRRGTGWQPTIPLAQTLLDVLNDYRQRVAMSVKADAQSPEIR